MRGLRLVAAVALLAGVTAVNAAPADAAATDSDLSLMLNAPATAAVGAAFPVTATVANAGPDALPLLGATVNVPIPTGFTFGTAQLGCVPIPTALTATSVTCTVPAIASGAAGTTPSFTLVPVRPAAAARVLTGTVSTLPPVQDPVAANNSDDADVAVIISTDLTPTLNGVPASIAVGAPAFTVSTTVFNAGPSDLAAGEASVTTTIPTGLTFGTTPLTCSVTPSAPGTTAITCPVAATASGFTSASTASLTISGVRPAGSRAITSTVNTGVAGQDPSAPAANTDTENVSVVISTDLTPTMNAPATAAVGAPFAVNASVLNSGPSDLAAGEATVTITLPIRITLSGPLTGGCTSAPGVDAGTTNVTCPVPATASGASSTSPSINVVATRPAVNRTFRATVNTVTAGQDPSPSSANSDDAVVGITISTDLRPVLAVSSAEAVIGGAPVTVSTTVFNAGPSDLAAGEATVTIALPAGLSFGPTPTGCDPPSGSTMVCAVPATASGSSSPTAAVTVTGNRPKGPALITATVNTLVAAQDPDHSNDSDTENLNVVPRTDLSPVLNGVPGSVEAGTEFTVSTTITNAGPSDLALGEATVTITLGPGLAFSGPVPATCTSTSNTVTCPVPAAASGATSQSLGVDIVGNGAGTRTISATVSTTTLGQDGNLSNNTTNPVSSVIVFIKPNITVTPTPPTQRIPFGNVPGSRSFTTSFVVENDDKQAVSNLQVAIPTPAVPAGTTLTLTNLTDGTVGPCVTATATCTYGTFAKDATVTITASWTITKPTSGLQFTATATASNPTPVNKSGTQVVDVVSVDLEATVTGVPNKIESGASFTATFTGTNNGPSSTGTGSSASMLLITWEAGLTAALPTGCVLTGPGAATCTLNPLASGQSQQFFVVFTGAAKGEQDITVEARAPGFGTADNEESTSKVDNGNTDQATVRVQETPGFDITATPPTQRVPVYPADPGPSSTTFVVGYTLTNDNKANIDTLVVTVPTPPVTGLTATSAAVVSGPAGGCVVDVGGLTTTCTFASFPKGPNGNTATTGRINITYTYVGSAPTPSDVVFTATATADENTPLLDTANATVSLVEAKADLQVVQPITYSPSSVLQVGSAPSGTFDATITLRNVGPDTALAPAITFTPGPNMAVVAGISGATCVGNVCTVTGGDMLKDAERTVVIQFRLTATPTGTHTRTAPFVASTKTTDPVLPNSGEVTGTINRAPVARPDVGAESGPAVPSGGTLTYKTFLNGDADPDGDGIKILSVGTPTFSAPDHGAVVPTPAPTGDGTLTVRPTLPADTDLTVDRVVKITIPVVIDDSNGATVESTLELAVTDALAPTVPGKFGDPPPSPVSFNKPVSLAYSANPLDVLAGERGENADGTPFATTPVAGATSYALTLTPADKDSLAVTGSTVSDEPGPGGRKVVSYVPAPGYTSDPEQGSAVDPPPDSFSYTATGTKDAVEVFSVRATVSVEVRNQNPIGLDSLITIDPGTGPTEVDLLANDIDGNTVDPDIAVDGIPAPFEFDDGADLVIACIGPVPPLNQTTLQPVADPSCGDPTLPMNDVDEELEITSPDETGTIKVLLDEGRKKVTVTISATVKGTVPFVAVVTDNRGGAGWSLVNIEIPNQPPEIIPETQIVPKNSPPVIVLDTANAVRDANGDVVKISSITDPPNGTAEITGGGTTITYEPDTDFIGPDSLVLNVTDDNGVGSNRAQLNIEVVEATVQPEAESAATGGGAGGAAGPAGSLAATGGDPVPLTIAAALSMILGFALVQASRRRRSRPLLQGARHLRV